jgi:hypothetical protein
MRTPTTPQPPPTEAIPLTPAELKIKRIEEYEIKEARRKTRQTRAGASSVRPQ